MMNAIISISESGGEDSLFTRYSRFFDRLDLGDLLLWDGDAADQVPDVKRVKHGSPIRPV